MTGASPGGGVRTDVGVEVALLDRDGVIAWVNQAWQAFAAANGGDPARTGRGVSYLQACAAAGDDPVAQEVAGAIRAALAGDLPGPLTVEVPCHSPATERSLSVLISSRFDDQGRCRGATVTLSLARPEPRLGAASPGRRLTLAQGSARKGADVMTPGVLWNMIEAFDDGVALADGEGTLVLARRRLEKMFGYQHTELTGQPVERLIPAHLQAAQARPVGTGVLLTGLRQDGTTFPVEISLSPVPTATGRSPWPWSETWPQCAASPTLTPPGRYTAASNSSTRSSPAFTKSASACRPPPTCTVGDAARPYIKEALRTLDDTISHIHDSTFADRED